VPTILSLTPDDVTKQLFSFRIVNYFENTVTNKKLLNIFFLIFLLTSSATELPARNTKAAWG
jgi:hypothetical protein